MCTPKGRDCFEKNSSHIFNCRVTCEGVHADVEWKDKPLQEEVEEKLAERGTEMEFGENIDEDVQDELKRLHKKLMQKYTDLEEKMKFMKGNKDKMGEEMDMEKFKTLLSEYKEFKMENVRHFKFDLNSAASMFGKFWPWGLFHGHGHIGIELQGQLKKHIP